MNKIKVAQIITRMDWGGSPDIVRIICERLDPEKYDFKLILGPSEHASAKTKAFLEKIKDKVIYLPRLKRDINLFHDFLSFVSLYRIFKREKFDIVHTHTSKAGALGRLAAKLAGVKKTIYFSHGHIFYGYFSKFFSKIIILVERFLSLFTTKFIVLTELEKRDMIAYKVSGPEKIEIVNSGLELDIYKTVVMNAAQKKAQLGIEKEELVVGMIGRLEPIKDPGCLVEAAQLIIEQCANLRFLIIGEGSLRQGLEKRCKELGIFHKFIFLGWREDVPEIIPVLDLLVLPSLNEAVGRVIVEAGACGVPTVATNVGGVPLVVQGNLTGMLFSAKDRQALAKAVIELLRNDQKRREMGTQAMQWVSDKFSAEVMVKRISDIYEGLINVT